MIKVIFVIRHLPFSDLKARESLEVALSFASMFEPEELAVLFINDGVFNLHKNQNSEILGLKNHLKMWRLLEMLEVEQIFVSQNCLKRRNLAKAELNLQTKGLNFKEIHNLLTKTKHIISL